MSEFDKLSADVIVYMALNMDLPEILSLCSTSTRFNKVVCLNKIFWVNRLKRDYKVTIIPKNKHPREYYREVREKMKLSSNKLLVESSALNDIPGIELALNNGANIHFANDMALVNASSTGNLEAVKYLIEKGANVNANSDNSLKMASLNGHLDVVKYLMEHGAIVDIVIINMATLYGQNEIVDYLVSVGAPEPTILH